MSQDPQLLNSRELDTSETDLTLHRPVAELQEPMRSAVANWLADHRIDPAKVAVDAPVTRHEASSAVSWREYGEDGLVVRTTFPAVAIGDRWPAPFPVELQTPQAAADLR